MNLALRFALRYIFSKKSTNVINLISMISVLGITLGSMALIVILSVFNGFEDLLQTLIGVFKPDIHITVKEGKVFTLNDEKVRELQKIEGVISISKVLEEIALFEYNGVQNIGTIKGVDENYLNVIALDSTIQRGKFSTFRQSSNTNLGVVGSTIEHTLRISTMNSTPVMVYMPKRKDTKLSITKKPFEQRPIYPVGVYSVRQVDYDNTIITNLKFVQEILDYKSNELSGLIVKIDQKNQINTLEKISKVMGPAFDVKNRYQQDEAFFKITNLEKWIGFIIFSFTLVLVAFNMVGALWMLVLEKRNDIAHLKAMGADNKLVRNIFLMEGALLSGIGVFVGTLLAVVLCLFQQEFGIIKLQNEGDSFLIQAYPVSLRIFDIFVVIVTVLLIGISAASLPAFRASKIGNLVKSE
jgi:lipoprotein-releasing system permease protein